MADIIEFGRRCESLKSEKDAEVRRRKVEALRKIFQCTRCAFKCAKCGTQLDEGDRMDGKYAGPYPFCRTCQEEYMEYRARRDGVQDRPRYYWHNSLWMQVWDSWLEHQRVLDQYRRSKEFLQLVQEVEDLLGK
ncbi:hypothetical protein SAMN02745206_02338 [Desulfacinum infernum DSM 9756]|jgi:hypothetical protein|uniref:Uncharacterized protein n=1 Tax=Desulfacinum infernum DSM 9756 TaxID=1121391 RepID=A0A1M5D3H6_9BACT|nr:hypothetical protein [Desulfacinum infernum]MBC7358697.1 hypothetical protein [Desulfacinum sp.]MBC7359284.1 hypothetical protein [Desulfacinum sp.]MBC7360401.1 hypothetical protein [Desulfacinum sp.]MBZ4658210.1 hypothetical protein [Desulfacinum sp.]SHF61549.1 hypothetical protein SAMN02745206_02338 [Desulfacinum infernum DSM 9756]